MYTYVMYRTIMAVFAATLIWAAPAHAGWRIDRAQQIAARLYPNACTGVAVRWSANVPASPDGAEVGGWVDPATACTVFFPVGSPQIWPEFCHRMIHEYGHLAGFAHTSDPGSPMYAGPKVEVQDWGDGPHGPRLVRFRGNDADMRCYDRGREFLGLHPARYGWN